MNFLKLVGVEIRKLRRSFLLPLLAAPVILMWIPSVLNAQNSFDTGGIRISPEHNFFIQGFMGMVWLMIPATLVICTVLLHQTEVSGRGMVKMLSLPLSPAKLSLAKCTVLILLFALQMGMLVAAYYLSALIASRLQDYSFLLPLGEVLPITAEIFLSSLPMAALYWLLAVLVQTPVFSIGAGLASIVPSVLMINTRFWFLYPPSYPFYVIMVEYGRRAEGIYDTQFALFPWLPAAAAITALSLGLACLQFGYTERR